eukprot:1144755-Pelagomonas_calceolata.AAC.1
MEPVHTLCFPSISVFHKYAHTRAHTHNTTHTAQTCRRLRNSKSAGGKEARTPMVPLVEPYSKVGMLASSLQKKVSKTADNYALCQNTRLHDQQCREIVRCIAYTCGQHFSCQVYDAGMHAPQARDLLHSKTSVVFCGETPHKSRTSVRQALDERPMDQR